MNGRLDTIDSCQAQLHVAGWSIGDIAIGTAGKFTWMVFAHRGGQRVVAKATRQAEAWREAVRLAHLDEFGRNGEGHVAPQT